MKRYLILCVVFLASLITLTSGMMDNNGRAGYTGSPGEATCNTTSCHNSFTLNSGGGSVSASSNMNNWTYDPNTTYYISVKVAKTGVSLFGVGVELLTSSNNNAGTITISDAVHTQIKTRLVSGVTRRNLVHKLNGGASQDSMIFTFTWTSPDTTTGPVTMYMAGNASNSNNNPSGDYIYTATQVITPNSGNKVNELKPVDSFSMYPVPATNNISIHYTLPKSENVSIKLYDLKGSMFSVLMNEEKQAGENNDNLSLPANCTNGVFMLSIESPEGKIYRKIIINQ